MGNDAERSRLHEPDLRIVPDSRDTEPPAPRDLPHRQSHSSDEMRALLTQALRATEPFVLAVCELHRETESPAERSHTASSLIAHALRAGDIAGILADRRVAVMLPHSTPAAARPVVARIERHLRQASGDWRVTVLSYPRHRALIERLLPPPRG